MEPIMGEIKFLAYPFNLSGHVKCDGSLLNIKDYTALYSLLGTSYGGDGVTTFAVPNLTPPKSWENGVYLISVNGVYPS